MSELTKSEKVEKQVFYLPEFDVRVTANSEQEAIDSVKTVQKEEPINKKKAKED